MEPNSNVSSYNLTLNAKKLYER